MNSVQGAFMGSFFSGLSIIKRLSLVLSVVILLVMGIFTMTLTSLIEKRLEQRVERDLSQQVTVLVNSMSAYNAVLVDSVNMLAPVFKTYLPGAFSLETGVGKQVPSLKAGSVTINGNNEIMDRFTAVTKAACTVFVRNGDDFYRVATSLKKEDGSRANGTLLEKNHPAFQALSKGEQYVGKALILGKYYMTKYVPVKDDQGRVIGAMFVGVDFTGNLKALKEKILSVKFGKTGYLYALDASDGAGRGYFHIHPRLEGKSAAGVKDAKGKEFLEELLKRKDGVTKYFWVDKDAGESRAREKTIVYHHLKEWNWVVAAGASMDELNPEGALVRNLLLTATAVVLTVLVGVIFLILKRWVSAPLNRLLTTTSQLAAGDFRGVSCTEVQKVETGDEVVLLTQGVQEMACSLRRLIETIDISALEVAAAAEQVKSSSIRIATSAEEVVAQVSTIATAGEEMSATSENIALNCQLAADGAQKASDSAHSGEGVVLETIKVMGGIACKVQETAKTVETLGERSDQIGAIIGTIEDIADQTNLLALNAAIEAARAGEQGRGFAVVADEVRALAERTTAATKEIGEMIKAIQRETKGAVAAMEEGVSQVDNGTKEAARSGEALKDILNQVNTVAMEVSQIATAAEEQTATTGEITKNMQQISDAVQQTSHGAQEAAAAATQLTGNAEELKRLIHRFRL